jgi:hypothetical protein
LPLKLGKGGQYRIDFLLAKAKLAIGPTEYVQHASAGENSEAGFARQAICPAASPHQAPLVCAGVRCGSPQRGMARQARRAGTLV